MGRARRHRQVHAAWEAASETLGIAFDPKGSDLGPVARGKVNAHVVSIAPVHLDKKQTGTACDVRFEAPEAPKFALTARPVGHNGPSVDTGNPKFDAVVSIETEHVEQLGRFLTGPRRAAILQLLANYPNAWISNRVAHVHTGTIETDAQALVDCICHLVAAAEVFDRPTTAPVPATAMTTAEAPVEARSDSASNMHDTLADVRLDEATVLDDLFNSGHDQANIAARFEQAYQGRKVSWTGEVLRVGAAERGMQRIATFVGSADGERPESGRVVAVTAVHQNPELREGDVLSFAGTLMNLNVAQRLFHVG